ncbi:MAG: DUF47 domain-containing protein [Brachymonas sp.]|jgi:predicted phosphate transport protein (TIGR00153 family)|nr:DUF47 domain-containing protein [Brachymonas sp.]MBP6966434.1 DUF47 domain-containing protein [Brachymonas sp.]MBP7739884.1 DUF47 domain-containing protein [Brachymonas sp.]MBP8596242.1 DUF47 domain-containing protein [Brachymonas sp.]MBP8746462.1 DUF47 domain-containing protein [Brachymonas sp.]
MFFSKLLPHDGNFFEQINQHANCILQAAQALSQLVTHYADPAQRQQYTQQVIDAEDRADAITHAVNTMLHKTFITPIDREQLHQLINAMDDVTDIIHDVAETMSLYDITSMTAEMVQLTQISLQGCEQLHTVVHQLDKIEKPNAAQHMLEICHTIDQLESDADLVMRQSLSRLFREEQDVRELIKLKAMYELLETVTDRCEDVANLIEGIVLENS